MHSNQTSHFKQVKEIPLRLFGFVWTEYGHLSSKTIQKYLLILCVIQYYIVMITIPVVLQVNLKNPKSKRYQHFWDFQRASLTIINLFAF